MVEGGTATSSTNLPAETFKSPSSVAPQISCYIFFAAFCFDSRYAGAMASITHKDEAPFMRGIQAHLPIMAEFVDSFEEPSASTLL